MTKMSCSPRRKFILVSTMSWPLKAKVRYYHTTGLKVKGHPPPPPSGHTHTHTRARARARLSHKPDYFLKQEKTSSLFNLLNVFYYDRDFEDEN
jgi:hypothetical protein